MKTSDLPNLNTNDVLLLRKLAESFKNSEHKDKEFMIVRLEEIAFKLEALESVLVKQWVGAMHSLRNYQLLVGEVTFCRKNIKCFRMDLHEGECKIE
jgi:hypothetical protein